MTKSINKLIPLVFIFLFTPFVHAEEVPDLDNLYADAVTAYTDGDIPKTFKNLDTLLEELPNEQKFLELKALALRKYGCVECAQPTYEKLMGEKKNTSADSQLLDPKPDPQKLLNYSPKETTTDLTEELAKAQIELADYLKKKGKMSSVKRFYQAAAKKGKATGAASASAHFFLAITAFKAKDFNEAEIHFNQAISSGVPKVLPASYFYLAKIRFARKDVYPAIEALKLAKTIADEQIKSTTSDPETVDAATMIYSAASDMLSHFNVSGYFGTATFLAGYDNNVLAVPGYQTSVVTTRNDSITTALSAGYGYSSSPANILQYVPSYKFSMNYNTNTKTLAGEFLTHDLSLTVTRGALNPQVYGARFEPILTYQDQTDDTTGKASFALYSYQLQFAPFYKTPIEGVNFLSFISSWNFGSELVFNYHHEFGDSAVAADQRRAGLQMTLKLTLGDPVRRDYWNPTFGFTLDFNNTSGTEYRDIAEGVTLSNVFHINEKMDISGSTGITLTSYPLRPEGSRADQLFNLSGSLVEKISPKWNLLATLALTDNFSNVPSVYGYNKYALSVGINTNF